MRIWSLFILSLVMHLSLASERADEPPSDLPDIQTLRSWIQEMKQAPRGPFRRLRWFCKDGTVLPPKPYACQPHGGGQQHGQWTQRTQRLREGGYYIANLLADYTLNPLHDTPDWRNIYPQILIERFLTQVDDDWILRRARLYRGAIQEESEREGARRILLDQLADPHWNHGRGFLALRTGARLLPHGADTGSVLKIRQLSADLSDRDPGFQPIRNKIHSQPEASDAQRVRDYAATDAQLRADLETLADTIDQIFQAPPLPEQLRKATRGLPKTLAKRLRQDAAALQDSDPAQRYHTSSQLLAVLRDTLPGLKRDSHRLRILDLSLTLENAQFQAASRLREHLNQLSRRQRLDLLQDATAGLYGTGLISRREWDALQQGLATLQPARVDLATYKQQLDYLGRTPAWATQWYRFHFGQAMERLSRIEPKAALFIQDQLRGSGLLFFSQVLDDLARDANHLAGLHHRLFEQEIGTGFRALNPGLARGTLHTHAQLEDIAQFDAHGIYLLPETVSDLPPVAGILTSGEGNPLSHVQLLARNLGIPNVGVDNSLLDTLHRHDGEAVVLAVSPGGVVHLLSDPGTGQAEAVSAQAQVVIRPDLEKLNLDETRFLPLSQLRAGDSGRVVGPKAAKLGELRHAFPEAVAEGLAIPFGRFRVLLEQPMPGEGGSVYQWMVDSYRRLAQLPEGPQRQRQTETFRARLQDWVLHADPGEDFRRALRQSMGQVFGRDGRVGVFVRSDTNVEDLPGFTGAGLNLTLPNVIGVDQVLKAIPRVWASPFSARAFAWRQAHMESPEAVYPAVLLLRSVPSEKSGVLVTQDIDTGSRDWLSVAVNEGVGGAVDGQAAESLRIRLSDGRLRLLAQATATFRRVLSDQGGVVKRPVSDDDRVLKDDEIPQLIELARQLPKRFPAIVDDQGNPAPADIEFGFVGGKLRLFQLRPFLESRAARGSETLQAMDQDLARLETIPVDLDAIPPESMSTYEPKNGT